MATSNVGWWASWSWRGDSEETTGVIFLNLEDETGLLNVIVLPDVWAAQREAVRRSVVLLIDGVLEHRDGVTNLVARRFTSRSVQGVKSRDWARGAR